MNGMDDLKMYANRVNRNCAPRDRKTDESSDGSLYLRMSDRLDDLNLADDRHDVLVGRRMNVMDDLMKGVNHVNRNCVRLDQNLVVTMGASRDRRMNDLLDDHSMVVNRVNRNYAPRDLMMDGNLDAMSHHVRLMVYLNMNCDRMSHDHLRCDRQMMRHRDTSRMDGMNLDGKILDGKLKNSGAMNSDARMT
jgi:hypothetical protein